jgi:hypothetical protein
MYIPLFINFQSQWTLMMSYAINIDQWAGLLQTFLSPPPGIWLALSKDPILDCTFQSSFCDSILNRWRYRWRRWRNRWRPVWDRWSPWHGQEIRKKTFFKMWKCERNYYKNKVASRQSSWYLFWKVKNEFTWYLYAWILESIHTENVCGWLKFQPFLNIIIYICAI